MTDARFSRLAALMIAAALLVACGENNDADAGPDGDVETDSGPAPVDSGVDSGPPPTDGGPTGCVTDCEYVEIKVGALHVCGRRENGEVLCWGRNQERQLGDNSTRHADCAVVGSPPEDCSGVPVNVRYLSGSSRPQLADATAIAVDGFSASCAIRESGELWCWSIETVPADGVGDPEQRAVAQREPNVSDVRGAAASGGQICVIEGSSGAVRCYGGNSRGQLGNGMFDERVVSPVAVLVPENGVEAVLDAGMPDGGMADDAGMDDGGVDMDGGMLDGAVVMMDAGVDAGPMSTDGGFTTNPLVGALEVGLGGAFACARTADDVYCWGRNADDQLGDGSATTHVSCMNGVDREDCSPWAVQVGGDGPARLGTVSDIDVGSHSVCAVKSGEVWCWGDNRAGQCGQPEAFETAGLPERVGTFSDAIAVAVGSSHACALHSDGTVSCWGSNLEYQLGDGVADHSVRCVSGDTDADCSRDPVDVAIIDDATTIAANSATTCVIRANGSVWCWGYNTNRQLGQGNMGTREKQNMPVMVMGTP